MIIIIFNYILQIFSKNWKNYNGQNIQLTYNVDNVFSLTAWKHFSKEKVSKYVATIKNPVIIQIEKHP